METFPLTIPWSCHDLNCPQLFVMLLPSLGAWKISCHKLKCLHIFESCRPFPKIPKPRRGHLFIPLKHAGQRMERRGLHHLLVFCKHRSMGSCLTNQNLVLRYARCLLVQVSTARLRVSLLDPQVHSCDPWLWGLFVKNGRNGHRGSEVTPSQTALIVT